ncbi:hypothetical protein GUITHDRAFT_133657 [Guillardia theta CCMP2712]|uniref:Uncharacterized protein n=1 Tax=Guillardia theta (strain CCMP2712) TaxID=905079 RepID=L1JW45_GUITC|nr:hypothetical protein GUITHDRAFT_133657 [Guillardia theta CCMP2712]EKX52607.1 hypothetical protein GUITHDRAFT_133657 [Guillardia theta CCMP2712]|eukprot:XP_005839587.1 hypothetical protein GUITHDRAFT_133657 [Guillardia theta CCMP2712]
MNKQLLDPFEADYPERIEDELVHEKFQARCCAFNRRGTLLATGCQDGAAALWDFDTRGVIKVLQDKKLQEIPAAIAAIGWSQDGRRIVTAEERGRVRVWDECERIHLIFQIAEPQVGSNARKGAGEAIRNYAASYSPSGAEVFVGNGKGMVSIWRVEDLEQLTRDGSYFLVSETGKIRVYDSKQSTLYREFFDQVNRTQWRKCCFSSDGNYVLGATAEKGEHTIHIWYRENGQLVHVLEGPKESVWDLAWHPTRTIIASCGQVYIWAKQYSENYSAFAPNFKELEENEEYIEREDEFDLIDHHQIIKKKREEEEAVEVDITTLDESTAQTYGLLEIPNELVYLPAIPDPDQQMATAKVQVIQAKRIAESNLNRHVTDADPVEQVKKQKLESS